MLKKTTLTLFLFSLIFVSCGDPCDEGYTQQVNPDGTTFCLPDYIFGSIHKFELGDTYYHDKHGVIIKRENSWVNSKNQIVHPE